MATAERERLSKELIERAKGVSVYELAQLAGAALRSEGPREFSGPCPKCGEGVDRFHVRSDKGFFCRRCHSVEEHGWGDAIEFVRWLYGLSFTEAIERLTGERLAELRAKVSAPSSPAVKAPERQQFDAEKGESTLATAQRLLLSERAGGPGRSYLTRRGLTSPELWRVYELGFLPLAPLPGTKGEQKAPAVVIPWRSFSGRLVGLRYRFLEVHSYKDTEGKDRETKASSAWLSDVSSTLFGFAGVCTLESLQAARALILCEGEINAMSIAAVSTTGGGWLKFDALSFGSESSRITAEALALARQYRRIFVWADRSEHALRQRKQAEAEVQAFALVSPQGRDANDLLQNGQLASFLALAGEQAARSDKELEGLLWDLWDWAQENTLEAGARVVLERLAERLGKQI